MLPVSGAMISEQLAAISEEYTINAVKIGLLVSLEQVTLLKQWIQTIRQSRSDELPVVLDPVAVASWRCIKFNRAGMARALLSMVDSSGPMFQL